MAKRRYSHLTQLDRRAVREVLYREILRQLETDAFHTIRLPDDPVYGELERYVRAIAERVLSKRANVPR